MTLTDSQIDQLKSDALATAAEMGVTLDMSTVSVIKWSDVDFRDYEGNAMAGQVTAIYEPLNGTDYALRVAANV